MIIDSKQSYYLFFIFWALTLSFGYYLYLINKSTLYIFNLNLLIVFNYIVRIWRVNYARTVICFNTCTNK